MDRFVQRFVHVLKAPHSLFVLGNFSFVSLMCITTARIFKNLGVIFGERGFLIWACHNFHSRPTGGLGRSLWEREDFKGRGRKKTKNKKQ